LYNATLDASLKSQLAQMAPNVNAHDIIYAGATSFRSLLQPQDLPAILKAYANSLDKVFYVVAAIAACVVSSYGTWAGMISERKGSQRTRALWKKMTRQSRGRKKWWSRVITKLV
jgi:hypothetical protein